MQLTTTFKTYPARQSRIHQVDFANLEFGRDFSDHMLICDYLDGEWQTPQIVPFSNLSLSPSTLALHYGQTVFEGMKAFRMKDGSINIFRIDRHYQRFIRSLDRMCMAIPPRELFTEGLQQLMRMDEAWVPREPGASYYIRPFMYASEARLGVKVSAEYRFIIFGGPVPELYSAPIKVKVETEFTRAAKGGTGAAKCGGNYGGAFYPTQLARQQGYDQLLWTTGGDNPTIEESGMMNAVFVIDNTLVTPPLSDSILDGVTRDSLLTLAKELGFQVAQRTILVSELENAFRRKLITEAFGVGTAAVVAPIGTIHIDGIDYTLPAYDDNSAHRKLKNHLEGIRNGSTRDTYGWNTVVK